MGNFFGGGGTRLPALSDNGSTVINTEPFQTTAAVSTTIAAYQMGSSAVGVFNASASTVGLKQAAGSWLILTSSGTAGLALGSDQAYGWASAATFATNIMDTGFRRRATANIQLGMTADVNGVPVAQTISVQNAITGSNLNAANWTFAGGLGTGTGTVGQIITTGGDSSVATGTTAQTGIIRQVLNATKALTTGAATTLVSIPLATLQMAGGYISVYMEATDGTNQATRCEEIYYAAENSAGVFVTSTGVVGTGVTAATATKTLTATYALTSANPALLQVTPTLTGITATRFTCVYEVHHMGNTQPTV